MVCGRCERTGFPPLMVGCVISLMLGLQLCLIRLCRLLCFCRLRQRRLAGSDCKRDWKIRSRCGLTRFGRGGRKIDVKVTEGKVSEGG